MSTKLRITIAYHCFILQLAMLQVLAFSSTAAAAQDVMLQTMNGQIVTGIVDDQSQVGVLGKRVFGGQFQEVSGTYRSSNPGFFSLRSGDPNMPSDVSGFPAQHDVSFDLLSMSIGGVASNLFYWNGNDSNGGGVDLSDVEFVVLTGSSWDMFDANFAATTASGTDQLVPGGLIQRTSTDIWPDAFNSGTIHKHLAMQVRDDDGNSGTTAQAGVYMISLQARSEGFETSAPFFFVLRSPAIDNAVRDAAVSWVEANIDALTSPSVMSGDYNADGLVDAADYIIWRKTGGGDYATWTQHFGEGVTANGPESAGVPEPSGCLLILVGVAGYHLVGGRQRWTNSNFGQDRLYSTVG